ncbi:unnamed protein product [Rhizoctonia solani]|uniref:Uncharacterized protein n=1 Tax=Rhizoctonia solani TaxID=456999 RepID=A0A8H3A5Q3_9AGAM|nr:unnamed protein product [Rhizoctonia solani]
MASKQSEDLARGKWFRGFFEDVDPDNDEDGLTEQRLEQWRPLWQNPFADPDNGLSGSDHSPAFAANVDVDNEKALEHTGAAQQQASPSQESLVPKPIKALVIHDGPTWVNLFYDLAWTATFSTLTQNGNFADAWDTVSYIAFFLVVWWLWASQTLYSIHFYTNDWFHLLSIFVQLIIFGLLAATTRGYDVTAYILRSPGVDILDPKTMDEMFDPDRYQKDRIASYSMRVIAFSLAASRAVHWSQHLFVWSYARRTAEQLKISVPLKLRVLPVGLAISNGLFWAAAVVTFSDKGKTVSGAKLKFIFWAAGLISEVLLHGLMEHLKWHDSNSGAFNGSTDSKETLQESVPPQPELHQVPSSSQSSQPAPVQRKQIWPVPRSNVNLRDRLEGITTVILGEGINGIAGTFYAAIAAPELDEPVYANIACAAIIVYFLAYFYFEGPTGRRDPKGSSIRGMMWLMFHLPFMLAIMLLLLGVKNQFLLTSYLSTMTKTFGKFGDVMSVENLTLGDEDSAKNMRLKNFLLKRGMNWGDEFRELNKRVTNNGSFLLDDVSDEHFEETVDVWYQQITLKFMVKLYEAFMGGNKAIDSDTEATLQQYYQPNSTLALDDLNGVLDANYLCHYERIINKLLESNLLGARYITGLAAVIFISLGIMNRVHSKPRVGDHPYAYFYGYLPALSSST